MVMRRLVAAETLDQLDARDPSAVRSRRDLRRIHRVMGTRSILLGGLADLRAAARGGTLRLLELGAGDGTLLLGVAKVLARSGVRADLTLLDRQSCVEPQTIENYARAGWSAAVYICDVSDWIAARGEAPQAWDAIVANLFLHHFRDEELAALLSAVAARTGRFFACEPRRAWLALGASHLVGALGANAVTREDAVLSVHAGFTDSELSALWPSLHGEWRLHEYGAGLFSHCLQATRAFAS